MQTHRWRGGKTDDIIPRSFNDSTTVYKAIGIVF